MSRRPHLLVLALLVPVVCTAQRPLQSEVSPDGISVAGDCFRVAWRADRGMQPAAVTLSDWAGEFRIDDPQQGVAFVAIAVDGKRYRADLAQEPTVEVAETTGTDLVFVVRSAPRDEEGEPCPLTLTQRFRVFGEGAVFCDLELALPEGGAAVELQDVEVGMGLATGELAHLQWCWKKTWQGGENLSRDEALRHEGYLRVMGATLSRQDMLTNHVEMFLEEEKPLGGDAGAGMWCEVTPDEAGAKCFSWHLGGAVRVGPGFSYSNRFGLAMGHYRQNDNAIGQRIAHWQEGNANLMTYPSDSAIRAMADCGVSVCVLHLYWNKGWGNYAPFNEADLRRWVASCHARGIKCVLYAVPADNPGLRGINREWIEALDIDGIYFDFGSVHFREMKPGGSMAGYEREFPGLDYLLLTRHYREAVGEEGIIISHSGGGAPDALFHLNLNAYLPGEYGTHAGMLRDLQGAAYHTGMAYAVVHPWCEYESFQTRHGAAVYCAVGSYPHILFGRGTHQDNNYHRSVYRSADFVLPYWQVLSLIPMDRDTTLYSEATATAASADSPDVHCCVYRRSPQLLLLTVSNLGEPCTPKVTPDAGVLGTAGQYRALLLCGARAADLQVTELGPWTGGEIQLPTLATDDICGVVLYQGELPPYTEEAVGRIRRLVSALRDTTPPSAVTDLRAEAATGRVDLHFGPATDEHHIVEYRVYRGEGAEPAPLATVEETTGYSDYTAPLGRPVRYAVSAVDAAGNEGPRSETVTATAGGTPVELGSLVAGTQGWRMQGDWLQFGIPRAPAGAEGDTVAFAPRGARFVRVRITGGQGNHGCAHVVEMRVLGPDGGELRPVEVTSSGSDPGHPVSEAHDGILDKTRNGWWSDRTRPLPAWVQFDLGQQREVASVWLLTYWDGSRFYDYVVEVSQDGQEWGPVGGTPRTEAFSRALTDVSFADGSAGVCTMEVGPERAGGGLLFRCRDTDNGYALYLDNGWDGNLVLAKLVDGKLQRIKAAFFPYSIHRPIPHRLQVVAAGASLRCYCDDVLAIEAEDGTYAEGKVGLTVPSGMPLGFVNLWAEGM